MRRMSASNMKTLDQYNAVVNYIRNLCASCDFKVTLEKINDIFNSYFLFQKKAKTKMKFQH